MASVAAPGSQPTNTNNAAPHGKKRAAENTLEHEQRLSKRFDLLNLVDATGTRLYIPVPGSSDSTLPRPASSPIPTAHPLAFTRHARPPRPPRTSTNVSDMDVEDTPHRVYIHDLAAELSDIESDEENPIFLSDIEKHLSKIPKYVLQGPEPKPNKDNQVVLYNVPSSLSVPEERDGVRRAIVEARRRVRERQASGLGEPMGIVGAERGAVEVPAVAEDEDAMDID
jgi:hypothetical protein